MFSRQEPQEKELQFWTNEKAFNYSLSQLNDELIEAHTYRRLTNTVEPDGTTGRGYINLIRSKLQHISGTMKREQYRDYLQRINELEQNTASELAVTSGSRERERILIKKTAQLFLQAEVIDYELRQYTALRGIDFRLKNDPAIEVLED